MGMGIRLDGDTTRSCYVFAAVTAAKILLMPSYHSTDFEVHRNWLAITHNVPFREWYKEATSEWTLDYPPLFAWFEYGLSLLARRIHPDMLVIQASPYCSPAAKLFQRGSVIASDCLLLVGALWCAKGCMRKAGRRWVPVMLITTQAALLLVDHVHFQYNGLLLGLLLTSVAAHLHGQVLLGGALFAALLNMKHLFLVLAPVQFVFILRGWVWGRGWRLRLASMGVVVATVFGVSLGPVILTGQAHAMLNRLFPFGRGLLHALWAANAWALYAAVDLVFAVGYKAVGITPRAFPTSALGTVQPTQFAVLPSVGAGVCAACVMLSMAPCLVAVWRAPRAADLPHALAYAALCGFVFGFHVHEKAAIPVLVLLAVEGNWTDDRRGQFFCLSVWCTYGVLPLFHEPGDYGLKMGIFCIGMAVTLLTLAFTRKDAWILWRGSWSTRLQTMLLLGLPLVEVYVSFLHSWMFGDRLPFMPLMMISCFSAIGICLGWQCLAMEWLQRARCTHMAAK